MINSYLVLMNLEEDAGVEPAQRMITLHQISSLFHYRSGNPPTALVHYRRTAATSNVYSNLYSQDPLDRLSEYNNL